jgi:plasmid stabilization system protein ParE
MAYELIWSPAARDDLHDIVIFIARDNPNRAMSFGYELTIFARSFFDRIELCTESITTGRFVRSRASGIQREEFRSYENVSCFLWR